MPRIVEIENHVIYPEYRDFNATTLARSHGKGIQGRVILIVKTDDGLEGLGEYWGPELDVDALCAQYVGTDPFDWLHATEHLWMNMALYDLMGKLLGVPAWKLIGPRVRSWMPVSAWTIAQPPAAMAEEVRQAAARGYRWIKYHVDQTNNVIAQTAAMQEAAPPDFRVHYDLNANLDFYTICPIIKELEQFWIAGRIEDPMDPQDEDGYRLLREKCKLPMITHHGPAEFMVRGVCDGYMSGHGAVGAAAKLAAVAEMTRKPLMLQNCGGAINQAFQAHQVAVFRMATIHHVNVSNLWKEDVTVEQMPVVGSCVQVPEGPGLGVTLDRDKLAKCASQQPHERGRYLVRLRYADGLTVCARGNPDQVRAQLRSFASVHGLQAPGSVPTYNAPVTGDYWDEGEEPEAFERWWMATESGVAWEPSRPKGRLRPVHLSRSAGSPS